MNTDGAHRANMNFSYRNGLIRDEDGGHLGSFNGKIGKCSVLQAEFWEVLNGLPPA